jgi:tetratricopeptide (TPR) repeat protein
MCEVIEGFGGCVRSYMGDGIAGFFGIDCAREDDAERAVLASLEIRNVVAAYSREVSDAWGIHDFSVRVGVNAGVVAVGVVGAGEPQRVALGDAVNVAARLQSVAAPGSIVIGEAVKRALDGRLTLRDMGLLTVKGRSSGVGAFELLDTHTPDKDTTYASPFIARLTELGVLQSALQDLTDGRGQVLLIRGEAGIGKSRLLDEARRRVGSEIVWLSGSCDSLDLRVPFAPFVRALRRWLGINRGSTDIEVRVRLIARGRELLGEQFDDHVGFLARLLDVSLSPRADGSLAGLPTDELATGVNRAYREWLVALARSTPVVLEIDNLGAASASTTDMAVDLLSTVDEASILFVLSGRSDSAAVRHLRSRALTDFEHRCTDVRIYGLAPADARAFVRALDQDRALNECLLELIVARAEGNPLFMEQLFASLTLPPGEIQPAVDTRDLPNPLQSLLLARIDALSAGAQQAMEAAAVLGRVFARDVLESMVGKRTSDAAVIELLRSDIIREKGRAPARYEFRHGLLREAALSLLTPDRSRVLNAAAADAVRAWSAFDEDRDSEALADYYVASGRYRDAMEPLERVADRFARVYRRGEALELYERCLAELSHSQEWDDVGRLARKTAELWASAAAFDRAVAVLDHAVASVVDETMKQQLQVLKARYLIDAGLVSEAQELLGALVTNEPTRDISLILTGQLALERGDLDEVDACLERLRDIDSANLSLRFETMSLAAGACVYRGDLDIAEQWCLSAQGVANQLGQVSCQLTARRRVAIICSLKGSTEEALEVARGVYRDCSRLRLAARKAEAGSDFIHIAHALGELHEAAVVGQEVLAEATALGPFDGVIANLAAVNWELGLYDEARDLALRALTSGRLSPSVRASIEALVAVERGAEGDFLRAAGHVANALEAHAGMLSEVEVLTLATQRTEWELIAGETAYAVEHARVSIPTSARFEPLTRAVLERVRLWAVGSVGETAAATVELMTLLEEVRGRRFRLEEGRLLMTLGDLCPAPRLYYFDEAERIFEACGASQALVELANVRARSDVSAPV